MLQRLSHLPITVDYRNVTWNANTLRSLISALRHPDRVCRITIQGSYTDSVVLSKAIGLSFPALESLELQNTDSFDPAILLASPFMTSIQSLRHLQLDGPRLYPILSEVLSVTTSLVDLTLGGLVTILSLVDGVSIFTHLQRMPHLRNLQLSTWFGYPIDDGDDIPPSPAATTLAELTYFRFSARFSEIEWFVPGLVAPSLLELYISIYNASDILHIPNLSKFICATGTVFFAARLTILKAILGRTFKASLFAFTPPLSIDDPPSKIVSIETSSLVRLDSASALMLTTVDDIFLSLFNPTEFDGPFPLEDSREFIKEFRNVKTLRLHHGLETTVADMLRSPTENPLPAGEEVVSDATIPTSTSIHHSGSQFTLDILPSLEEIVVYARAPNMSIDDKEGASALESFGPFMTARHRVGRPVKVFWNADGKVPRYFLS